MSDREPNEGITPAEPPPGPTPELPAVLQPPAIECVPITERTIEIARQLVNDALEAAT